MLFKLIKYGFRQRKHWQAIINNKIDSISQFKSKCLELENKIFEQSDRQQFERNLLNKAHKLQSLFSLQNFETQLDDTIINGFVFHMYNHILEDEFKLSEDQNQLSSLDSLKKSIHKIIIPLESYAQKFFILNKDFIKQKKIINPLRRRFSIIEEKLCEIFFQGYIKFKKGAHSEKLYEQFISETDKKSSKTVGSGQKDKKNTKVQFREDFSYKLNSNITIAEAEDYCQIFNIFRKFNMGTKKIYLIVEFIFLKFHLQMATKTVAIYLSILAHSKRAIKQIESNFILLMHKHLNTEYSLQNKDQQAQKSFAINLLNYISINKISQFECWNKLIKYLSQKSIRNIEESKQDLIKLYLLEKYLNMHPQIIQKGSISFLNVEKSKQIVNQLKQQNQIITPEQQEFQNYLKKYHYIYTIQEDPFKHKKCYILSNKNYYLYFDLNYFLFKNQEIGQCNLIKDYYKNSDINLRSINIHRIINARTRRQVYQYYHSKLRKQQHQNIKKPLYYDF